MTDTREQLKPEGIPYLCQSWQEEHGKLNETNFIKCIIHFAGMQDMDPKVLTEIVTRVIEVSGVELCSHCGAIPARAKDVNGRVYLLCSCCRDSVLFQDLGPQEGYT